MRAKFLLRSTISVLGMGLAFYCSEASADDVYVDLSVLDALGTANSPVINSAPLFPVVSSTPQFPEVKKTSTVKKTAPKVSVKKSENVKQEPMILAKEDVKASEEKLNIPSKKDIAIDLAPKEPEDTTKEVVSIPFAEELENSMPDEVSAAPVAPVEVDVEDVSEVNNPVIMEPINGATQLPDVAEKNDIAPKKETSDLDVLPETAKNENTDSVAKESLFTLTEKTPETVEKKAPRPLIDNAPYDVAPVLPQSLQNSDIVFAEDSDELTDADKQKIDDIVSNFENPQVNKIAIYSYNLDTGKDSFYRKRMSLNRAVGVRSYLLGKGYKNFSIKVINIDEDNGKSNSVSIEELK